VTSDAQEKLRTGGGVCKDLSCQKSMCGRHLEVRQKYCATRRIFDSLLSGWKCGQTRSVVFEKLYDISLRKHFPKCITYCEPVLRTRIAHTHLLEKANFVSNKKCFYRLYLFKNSLLT